MLTDDDRISLADKAIWIIDDDIPIASAEFEKDDMLTGNRPIDHGALLALLSFESWDSAPVRALCEQLVREAKNVTAFLSPASAISHLNNGAQVPDVVVYDLVYRSYPSGKNSLEELDQILSRCVSVVQVYTQESLEQASRDLEPLLAKFPSRLEKPALKASTTAEELAGLIKKRLQNSLSARLAAKIRRLSSAAVEDVLVKIDDLPLNVAVRLLAGATEAPDESELVELLSVKVSEALGNASELDEAVRQYLVSRGISTDRANEVAHEIVVLLVTHVLEHLRNDGGLFSELQSAWEAASVQGKSKGQVEKIIQEFFAFRVYAQPTDNLVRTGDIIAFKPESDSQDVLDLYLVVTPACDLARFWKKTRGTLTLIRMRPLAKEKGLARVQSYGTPRFQLGESITAKNPMIMPSIPISPVGRLDYALFAHEVISREFEKPELTDVGSGNRQVERPLTYNELGNVAIRKCRVSEPFLAGILAELASILFRLGIPDYPKEEQSRLRGLFNA